MSSSIGGKKKKTRSSKRGGADEGESITDERKIEIMEKLDNICKNLVERYKRLSIQQIAVTPEEFAEINRIRDSKDDTDTKILLILDKYFMNVDKTILFVNEFKDKTLDPDDPDPEYSFMINMLKNNFEYFYLKLVEKIQILKENEKEKFKESYNEITNVIYSYTSDEPWFYKNIDEKEGMEWEWIGRHGIKYYSTNYGKTYQARPKVKGDPAIDDQAIGGKKKSKTLDKCTLDELKAKAKKRGIKVTGLKKAEIIAKLRR